MDFILITLWCDGEIIDRQRFELYNWQWIIYYVLQLSFYFLLSSFCLQLTDDWPSFYFVNKLHSLYRINDQCLCVVWVNFKSNLKRCRVYTSQTHRTLTQKIYSFAVYKSIIIIIYNNAPDDFVKLKSVQRCILMIN